MLAGGALAVAGLVACNSAEADPDPESTAPTAPGATETEPEPDPTESDDEVGDGEPDDDPPGPQEYEHPEPGEDIDDDGQAGAEAAAVYFVELNAYVYATGEFEAWDELTAEGCQFCAVVRDRVGEIYGAGGFAVTSPPSIRNASAQLDPSVSGAYVVEINFLDTEVQLFDGSGESVDGYAPADTHAWILVERPGDEWSVLEAQGEVAE